MNFERAGRARHRFEFSNRFWPYPEPGNRHLIAICRLLRFFAALESRLDRLVRDAMDSEATSARLNFAEDTRGKLGRNVIGSALAKPLVIVRIDSRQVGDGNGA